MRRVFGSVAALLFSVAMGLYVSAWTGSLDVSSLGGWMWFLHLSAMGFSIGTDRILKPSDRPIGGHLNIRILKAYLSPGAYRALLVVFWICMAALGLPLLLLSSVGEEAGGGALAVFSAVWALFFYVAAAILLQARKPESLRTAGSSM